MSNGTLVTKGLKTTDNPLVGMSGLTVYRKLCLITVSLHFLHSPIRTPTPIFGMVLDLRNLCCLPLLGWGWGGRSPESRAWGKDLCAGHLIKRQPLGAGKRRQEEKANVRHLMEVSAGGHGGEGKVAIPPGPPEEYTECLPDHALNGAGRICPSALQLHWSGVIIGASNSLVRAHMRDQQECMALEAQDQK